MKKNPDILNYLLYMIKGDFMTNYKILIDKLILSDENLNFIDNKMSVQNEGTQKLWDVFGKKERVAKMIYQNIMNN